MTTISVDFSKRTGPIKPFNAVNNAPVNGLRGINNMESWKAAHIPYGRLHDTALCSSYGGEWVVDLHRIFRDFDADETDPKNYIFAPTDKLLNAMLEAGTKPYFRLGATNGKDSAVLISYFNQDDGIEEKTVCLKIENAPIAEQPLTVRLLLLDEAHNLECVREQTVASSDFMLTLQMPPYATYLIEIQAI